MIIPNIPSNATWERNGVTVAGGNGSGYQPNHLYCIHSVYVVDDETILVADMVNNHILKWKYGAATGQVVAGGNRKGGSNSRLNYPTYAIIDKDTGDFIICDQGNNRVTRWSPQNQLEGETILNDFPCGNPESPCSCFGLDIDDHGSLYVSLPNSNEVRRYCKGETTGAIVTGGNEQGDVLNQLCSPTHIFVDQACSVYVFDFGNNRVMKWVKDASEGIVVAGGQGQGDDLTQLSCPAGVFVDQLDTVYVVDSRNNRVMRWPAGATQGDIIAGKNRAGGQADELYSPTGIAFDCHGNLYVADCSNYRVQRFAIKSN